LCYAVYVDALGRHNCDSLIVLEMYLLKTAATVPGDASPAIRAMISPCTNSSFGSLCHTPSRYADMIEIVALPCTKPAIAFFL
jgi:hypothetical protein